MKQKIVEKLAKTPILTSDFLHSLNMLLC